jgi:integrase
MKNDYNALLLRHGIVMSFLTFKNVPLNQNNIGFWMGAKIYSDIKGNKCSCGGSFNGKESFRYRVGQSIKELNYPVCNLCQLPPAHFRIRAKVSDPSKKAAYVFIRHDKGGNRLVDPLDACQLIKQIDIDSSKGSFDFKEYDSKKALEYLRFPNVFDLNLVEEENRMKLGELTPKSFLSKKSCGKILREYFEKDRIHEIDDVRINEFKKSFTDRTRTRDLCLGELKFVLKTAKKKKLITVVPDFDPISKARKREQVISMDDARKIVEKVVNPVFKTMIELLMIYPVRPSELRALQWRDIKWDINKVVFERHFSANTLIHGRKSISKGNKSRLKYKLCRKLKEYLSSIPQPLNKEEFVFSQGINGFVSEDRISDEWRIARKKTRIKGHSLYELRHARLTELAQLSNGNITKMLNVSGHTNSKTLIDSYIRDDSDMDEFFD